MAENYHDTTTQTLQGMRHILDATIITTTTTRGVVAILDLGERFWKRGFRHRGRLPPEKIWNF